MQTSGVGSVFDALAVNIQPTLRDSIKTAISAFRQVKMSPEDNQRLKQKWQDNTNKLPGAANEVCHSAPGLTIDCSFLRF
jgi:hypothetical protein